MQFFQFFVARPVAFTICLVLVAINHQQSEAQLISPPASTVQLPTFGVAVDPKGLFQVKQFAPPGGQAFIQLALNAHVKLPRKLQAPSKLRKVSLRRLMAAIEKQLDQGLPLSDTMLHLAGLTQINYAYADPAHNDIILAGPAQGWLIDAGGRSVGMHSGKPIVLLDDLIVALRCFRELKPKHWVGCSIGPPAESLRRLREFQKALPDRIPRHAEEQVARQSVTAIEQALGLANISVFGVSASSHLAQVMVEADYRMKLIAIGREPPPIDMPTFFSELRRPGKNMLQRWWFTPKYQRVIATVDELGIQLTGPLVKLGTEDYRILVDGGLQKIDNKKPMQSSRRYAESFTKNYEKIAEMSPVFGQLRHVVDLLVASAWINNKLWFDRVDFNTDLLFDAQKLPAKKLNVPRQAPMMANAVWRKHRLIAPSGGVCILAEHAIIDANLIPDKNGQLAKSLDDKLAQPPGDQWWWD